MKFSVHQIKRDGLFLDEDVKPKSIGFSDEEIEEIGLKSDIGLKAKLERIDGGILARAEVEATYAYTCGRCLEEMEAKITDSFDIFIEKDPSEENFDFGEELRQEIIIAHNPWVLCEADKNGNCIQCGKDIDEILKGNE